MRVARSPTGSTTARPCASPSAPTATRAATVDFVGPGERRPDNFNAPRSVVRTAVLYVLRLVVGGAIPLNDGFPRPVTIVIPDGSMLSPRHPAAVVAGNVETSQVVTDALLGVRDVMAGSQGTMNNLTFGDDARQYHGTIRGGAGATRVERADGAGEVLGPTAKVEMRAGDTIVIDTPGGGGWGAPR